MARYSVIAPARAHAELQLLVFARGRDDVEQVIVDRVIDANVAGRLLQFEQLVLFEHGLQVVDRLRRCGAD